MTTKDRKNMFVLMAYYNMLDKWIKDATSEIVAKDKSKIKCLMDTTILLLNSYRKREGQNAFDLLMNEAKDQRFYIASKEEKEMEVYDNFEMGTIKTAIKDAMKDHYQCCGCIECDFNNCKWFTINKFVGNEKLNFHKGECPYKTEYEEIDFDNLDNLTEKEKENETNNIR